MSRPIPQHTEPVNSDSFLDIVASVVSIMIIMVVMEGMRIKNAPVTAALPAPPADAKLEKDLAAEQSLRGDVWKLAEEIQGVQREVAARGTERDLLATTVAAVEHQVQERRQRFDGVKRADFDLAQNLAQSKFQLDQLARERQQAENTPGQPVVVESYPTPISREVDGPEAHLLIVNGRVMFIPLEEILDELRAAMKRQAYKLADQSELSDTIGPVDGFRLRYTIKRHDVAPDGPRGSGRGGSFVRVEQWTLIPVADDLGEPVRLALEPGSDFRHTLSKILPGRTTLTIWVYPDGFDAFRQIRKELYGLGYSIAARPLPPGTPIGGSPDGSKSAAQ
jgi:hypothetical protein